MAAALFFGLEQLSLKLGVALRQLLIGEFGERVLGEEVVGDETGAFGLRQPVLQSPELLVEPVVLGPAVLEVGA